MPSSSHQNCAEPGCRIRVHKRNRYGRCYQHYKEYDRKLRAARRPKRRMSPLSDEVRAVIDEVSPRLGPSANIDRTTFREITAARLEEETVVEPPATETVPVPPTVEKERRYRSYPLPAGIDDEVKQEILLHYENLDIPVTAICSYFHISSPTLLGLIEEYGVTQRAKRPDFKVNAKAKGHFEEQDGHGVWVVEQTPAPEPTVPEPQRKALENMLQPPPPPVVEEPEERYVPARVVSAPRGGPMWKVVLTTEVEVRGSDIEIALQVVRRSYPRARITSIAEMPGTTV